MKNNLGTLQIFSVTNEEMAKKKRIDVEYYQPFFEHVVAQVSDSKFHLQKWKKAADYIQNQVKTSVGN